MVMFDSPLNMLLTLTYSPRVDERNPPPLGRIGDPDDIIGSVRVENGKVGQLSDLNWHLGTQRFVMADFS